MNLLYVLFPLLVFGLGASSGWIYDQAYQEDQADGIYVMVVPRNRRLTSLILIVIRVLAVLVGFASIRWDRGWLIPVDLGLLSLMYLVGTIVGEHVSRIERTTDRSERNAWFRSTLSLAGGAGVILAAYFIAGVIGGG